MKPRRLLLFIVLLITLAFGSACERAGLYDLAKNGEGLVYIVTKDVLLDVRLIATTGEEYFKQYYVGNTPNVIEGVFASERGEVFILRTVGMFYSDGDYSHWTDMATPFGGAGTRIFSAHDTAYAVNSGGSIYRWDGTLWVLAGAFLNPPALAYAFEGDTIYCVGNINHINSYHTGSNSFDSAYNNIPSFLPAAPAGTLYAHKCGGRFFIGGSDGLFLDPVSGGRAGGNFTIIDDYVASVIPATSAESFAVVECDDIFAGVRDGNLIYLLRYSAGTWINEGLPFTVGGVPGIVILPLRPGKLALWAKGVTEQGVYTYDYDERKLHKITGVDPLLVQRINTSYRE
jgi:hypothetical protein